MLSDYVLLIHACNTVMVTNSHWEVLAICIGVVSCLMYIILLYSICTPWYSLCYTTTHKLQYKCHIIHYSHYRGSRDLSHLWPVLCWRETWTILSHLSARLVTVQSRYVYLQLKYLVFINQNNSVTVSSDKLQLSKNIIKLCVAVCYVR